MQKSLKFMKEPVKYSEWSFPLGWELNNFISIISKSKGAGLASPLNLYHLSPISSGFPPSFYIPPDSNIYQLYE